MPRFISQISLKRGELELRPVYTGRAGDAGLAYIRLQNYKITKLSEGSFGQDCLSQLGPLGRAVEPRRKLSMEYGVLSREKERGANHKGRKTNNK